MAKKQPTFFEVYRNACVNTHGFNNIYSLKKFGIDIEKKEYLYPFFKATQDLLYKKISFFSWIKALNQYKEAISHRYYLFASQRDLYGKKCNFKGENVVPLIDMILFKACVDEVCDSYSLIIDTVDETDSDGVKIEFWNRVYCRLNNIQVELDSWFINISTYNDPNMEGAEKRLSIDEPLDHFNHESGYLGLFFERIVVSFKYLLYYFIGYTKKEKKGNQNV
jgi:hypothetical protein